MSGVSGGLDKETYKKGEDIVLTCKGSFRPEDEQDEGSILLSFCIYKVIDGKKDYENFVAYKIIDYGKMEYKFDNYEGMTCLKDIERFNVDLEKIYSIKLSNERIKWQNPDIPLLLKGLCNCYKYLYNTFLHRCHLYPLL